MWYARSASGGVRKGANNFGTVKRAVRFVGRANFYLVRPTARVCGDDPGPGVLALWGGDVFVEIRRQRATRGSRPRPSKQDRALGIVRPGLSPVVNESGYRADHHHH